MGCDIHLFGEKKVQPKWWQFWKKAKWVTIDKYSDNPDYGEGEYDDHDKIVIRRDDRIYTDGRNYNLFCALAGVRSYCFEGEPPILSEPKGIPSDCSPEYLEQVNSYGSDGHSHSWATLKELLDFNFAAYGKTCNRFLDEVIPKLKSYKTNPEDIRIVFFFDN